MSFHFASCCTVYIVFFQDQAFEERSTLNSHGQIELTGRMRKRLCLVLDCLIPHEFSTKTSELMNLQYYVIREKKLSEREAIVIFFDIVRVVNNLHKVRYNLYSFSTDLLLRI